jgi:hypothetical protein
VLFIQGSRPLFDALSSPKGIPGLFKRANVMRSRR